MSNQPNLPNQPHQPSGNPLVDLIPASQRKRVYALFGLVGLVLGAVFIAYSSVTQDLPPTWLLVSTVVYNFLGVPFSALASSNTKPVN